MKKVSEILREAAASTSVETTISMLKPLKKADKHIFGFLMLHTKMLCDKYESIIDQKNMVDKVLLIMAGQFEERSK